jgi:diguanylate cyclase (GGDEF)-like protein
MPFDTHPRLFNATAKSMVTKIQRVRIGIAARLLIGLLGAGGLVLAANFLVEQRILIENTTQITRIEAPLPIELTVPPVAPGPRLIESRKAVRSDALMSAIGRFGRAVQGRVENNGELVDIEKNQSASELARQLNGYVADVDAITANTDVKKVASAMKSYQTHANDLIFIADNSRGVLARYTTLFEDLNTRVKQSLDAAWKIFGRVVARQSLLRLSADLDNLRQSSIALGRKGAMDPAALATLAKNEESLSKTLETNEKGFRRSEGDAWYEAMHDDLVKLFASRKLFLQVTQQLSAETDTFTAEGARLATLIPGRVEGRAREHESLAPAAGVVATPVADTQRAAAPVAPQSAPVIRTQSVMNRLPQDIARRRWLAWISALVIAGLVYVCASTVLSVMRPIRRLLAATSRIANGDATVRVARGGLKELDTLAEAFNRMADRLDKAHAIAHEHQQNLESKVIERTQQLQELAERDPLTGLPNRRQLFDLLNAAIHDAGRRGRLVAVFFLDIDNFKFINDSLGHAFGDRVLLSLSSRLQEAARPFGFAARLGGDEFTVVFEDAGTAEEIRAAGLSVVQAFQQPLSVDGRDLIVSVSVGASIYPDHELDAEALLQAADAALFRAKKLGRSQLSVFTPDLLETAAANFTTEQGLRRAIERGEFELLFQPEVNVETLETGLVEALIRWRMPDGSLASPGQFLAVAEESGLIIEISDWVLRSAIEAAAHWHHGVWPEARVAINVSPRQLFDHQFVDRLQGLLDQYRLPAKCIEIELTESVLQTGPATIDALRRLRAKGIAIALDDFGTGYSSLASLEQLPLNRIKLDRSLIAGIDTSARSGAIARAIIGMCQGLGLEITAEGVERPEQFSILLGYRSMYLQGYLFSPPVSRDELIPAMAQLAARAQELLLTAPNVSRATVLEFASRHERDSVARGS